MDPNDILVLLGSAGGALVIAVGGGWAWMRSKRGKGGSASTDQQTSTGGTATAVKDRTPQPRTGKDGQARTVIEGDTRPAAPTWADTLSPARSSSSTSTPARDSADAPAETAATPADSGAAPTDPVEVERERRILADLEADEKQDAQQPAEGTTAETTAPESTTPASSAAESSAAESSTTASSTAESSASEASAPEMPTAETTAPETVQPEGSAAVEEAPGAEAEAQPENVAQPETADEPDTAVAPDAEAPAPADAEVQTSTFIPADEPSPHPQDEAGEGGEQPGEATISADSAAPVEPAATPEPTAAHESATALAPEPAPTPEPTPEVSTEPVSAEQGIEAEQTAEPPAAPEPAAAPASSPAAVEKPEPADDRLLRLRERLAKSGSLGRGVLALLTSGTVDENTWDEIEETLLIADLGPEATDELMDNLRTRMKVLGTQDYGAIKEALREELVRIVDPELDRRIAASRIELEDGRTIPAVVLMVGVNGTGKTTTVGKLARVLVAAERSVVLGAADTFRAAAAEQLATWGERVGVETVRSEKDGADPASVAFDAVKKGVEDDVDVVIVDTAGRLQNKQGLMDQLGKVKRVAEKPLGGESVAEVLLVLDATTGQNGMQQARVFAEAVNVTGLVLTKLDGTAKGGIVVNVQRELGVPVKMVGLGEGMDDLAPFDAYGFVDALLGD